MNASSTRIQRSLEAPQHRQEQHPEDHRDHADVDAEQGHQPEEAAVGLGRLDRDGDLVVDRRPGRGEHRDRVGLALLPRVVERQRLRAEAADRARRAREVDVGVVDEDLGDLRPDRARCCARVSSIRPGSSIGALDRELLDRRAGALGQRGAAGDARGAISTAAISATAPAARAQVGTPASGRALERRRRRSRPSIARRPRRSPSSRARRTRSCGRGT